MDFAELLREKAIVRSPNPADHEGVKRRWEWQCADRIKDLEAALSTETQRRERFEEDVECTHKWLDEQGAPREIGGGKLSLVGRIMRLTGKD